MTKPLLKGVLKTWKEDRGFGFISPENGGRDLFIHISALGESASRPKPGDIVHYQISRDRQGKLRAINASIEGMAGTSGTTRRPEDSAGSPSWLKIGIVTLIAISALVIFYLKSQNFI